MDTVNLFLSAGGGSIITLLAYLIWRICSMQRTSPAAVAASPVADEHEHQRHMDTIIEVRSARMDDLQDQISHIRSDVARRTNSTGTADHA